MKFRKLLWFVFPITLAAGCVYSHREPVTYTTPAASTVVVPTSTRPATRVYPPATTVVTETPVVITEAPPGVPSSTTTRPSDLALANSIRGMLGGDSALAAAARNVRMSVYDGRVALTGTTFTDQDREQIHSAIASLPGVTRVEDNVQVYPSRTTTVVTTPAPVVTPEPAPVIAPAPVVVTEVPAGVPSATPTSADLGLAQNIRSLLATDDGLNSAARNVRFSVYDGQVTMTGTTVTQNDRQKLQSAIKGLPGVYRVDDRVQVDLNR